MKKLTPGTAIKMFCKMCQGIDKVDATGAVRKCKSKWGDTKDKLDAVNFPNGCPLWPFRIATRHISDEVRAERSAKMKEIIRKRKQSNTTEVK